ncbi:MAG: ParB/RepB/Spo0J family partition protein [Desulfococcaceae bacterium]
MSDDRASNTSPRRRKPALGRGLGALIPAADPAEEAAGRDFQLCELDRISPNRYQPRRRFPQAELEELSRSIAEQGVIQPLIVRRNPDGYELVAGERRLRAARMAGLERVPVVIKPLTDAQVLEMALVENIQRADLNPVEEAEAYHRLMTEFDLTQERVADRVGKSRSAVANFLRLRGLPDPVREALAEGRLTMGHAKALLGVESPARQLELARRVLEKGLSVRETERLAARLRAPAPADEVPDPEPDSETIHLNHLAEDLARRFGTRVKIQRRGQKGRVELEFYNDDDLDRLLRLLNPDQEP